MNERRSVPRWAREQADDPAASPTEEERVVLLAVLEALRRVRHGSVSLSLQDGHVVQIDTTEKTRL